MTFEKNSAQTFDSSHLELRFLQITLQLVRSCTSQSLKSTMKLQFHCRCWPC